MIDVVGFKLVAEGVDSVRTKLRQHTEAVEHVSRVHKQIAAEDAMARWARQQARALDVLQRDMAKTAGATSRLAVANTRYAHVAAQTSDVTGRLRQQFLATANTIAILDGPLGGIASRFSAFGVLLGRTGLLLGVVAVGFTALGAAIGQSVRAGMAAETSMLSLRAAVQATGGAAGVTALQIEKMARAIEAQTLASRDGVRQAATQLLTFETVTGEMFERTLRISQDIAQVFGRDIVAVSLQVAKALDNPAQSLASLERAYGALRPGIRATAIALKAQGREAEALDLIMSELERRFAGMGSEAAAGLAGAFDTLRATITNFRESLFSVVDGENRVTRAVNNVARGVDFLRENMNRFIAIGQTVAGVVLVRYIAGVRMAAVATAVLTGNVVALSAAFTRLMARTGVGLLVLGLGELVYQLGFARDGSRQLAEALAAVSAESQTAIGNTNALVAEVQRLGTVSRAVAQDTANRLAAQRAEAQAVVDAMRAEVLVSKEFQQLARQEAAARQRINALKQQGADADAVAGAIVGGDPSQDALKRAEAELASLQAQIESLFAAAVDPAATAAVQNVGAALSAVLRALRESQAPVVNLGEGVKDFEQSAKRVGAQMLENNDLRARELGLLNAGNSVEQVRLQMQREQEESQLQLLEVEARRVLALNDATQEARAFAETVLIATERARTLATALEEARRFADMRAEIDTTIEGMQKENDLLETQLGYMEAGLEAAEARARAEVQLQIALARTLWLEGQITQEKFEQLAITLTDLAARGAELRASIQSLARPARGGGGGRDTDRLDAVQQLQQEIERTRTLLTLSAQEVALKQEMWRITDALGTDRAKYSDAFIAQLVREKLALEEQKSAQEEMLQQQQELFNKVQTSMENAFMSMVDGTKSAQDAFKDMARVIIAELFRVLVVQQLVGSFDRTTGEGSGLIGAIAGGLGFANGGAFSNGSVMPFANGAVLANMNRAPNVVPFARGGVVGSAALFPMTGGRTGLMGEAGPEAIMPLKRGKDGKLGVQAEGGSTVHIVQNFSVAANGDESVKRIVAQQVPAIAEATKAAVIDARKRGGQMRAAFR